MRDELAGLVRRQERDRRRRRRLVESSGDDNGYSLLLILPLVLCDGDGVCSLVVFLEFLICMGLHCMHVATWDPSYACLMASSCTYLH
ncbi:hypothetical protein RJT34_03943 [Clitoria ternatea]|uniref:Uncharacterized protein n=1 Tax=Clitoria ternatea TaxID=43366 RepID=A0AAN9KJY8_CLITE